jgi:hypothetical protein
MPSEIGHMNEREARESGLSPKAQLLARIHLFRNSRIPSWRECEAIDHPETAPLKVLIIQLGDQGQQLGVQCAVPAEQPPMAMTS